METLRLSARLARSRPGETFVAVLCVALGVGALVGVATLIRGYDEYQARLERNPLSREMTVSGFRGQQDSDVSVAPDDETEREPVRLSLADGAKAMAEVEGLSLAYQYNSRRYTTAVITASNFRGPGMDFGGGGPTGGPAGGPPPEMIAFAAQPGGASAAGAATTAAATQQAGAAASSAAPGAASATDAAAAAPAAGNARRAARQAGSAATGAAAGAGAAATDTTARQGGGATARAAAAGAAATGANAADPMQAFIREQQAALEAAAKVPADEVAVEQVMGIQASPSFFGAFELTIAKGSLFDDTDISARRNVAVIGAALAKILYNGADVMGKRIRLNGTVHSIIGVLAPDTWEDGTRSTSFDDMVFTPLVTRSFRAPNGQTIAVAQGADSLSLMASAGGSPAVVGADLQKWFDRSYGEGNIRVRTAADRFRRGVDQRRGILFVLTILAGAAAAAAAVNLFNIMAGRVLKRSRSYGIMRAIGAPSDTVFASVMAETGIAAGIGALASLVLSPLLFFALEGALTAAAGNRIPVRLDPIYLLLATVAATGVAVLLVAAPARSAARAPIADALKSE